MQNLLNSTGHPHATYKPRFRTTTQMEKGCTVDVLLCQPPLTRRIGYEEQDETVRRYFDSMVAAGNYLGGDDPHEPNNGLLILAAALRHQGFSVGYIDFHTLDLWYRRNKGRLLCSADIERILGSCDYKVLGISTICVAQEQSNIIGRSSKKKSNATVCVGGLLASAVSQEMLVEEQSIDIVVRGLGLQTFPEVVQCLIDRKDFSHIPAITFRAADGSVIVNPEAHSQRSNPIRPKPAFDLVPSDIPLIPRIETSIGCRGSCVFCSPNDRRLHLANLEEDCDKQEKAALIVQEIDLICSTYGVDFFLLGNLSLFDDSELDEYVCKGLERTGAQRQFWCQMRLDDITYQRSKLLKKAGCIQVAVGIETASSSALARCGKHYGMCYGVEKALGMLKDAGLSTYGYIIIGLPEEREVDIQSTISMIDQLLADELLDGTHISILVPYPGTPLYEQAKRLGIRIISDDFNNYWMNCDQLGCGFPVYETQFLRSEQIYALWLQAILTATEHYNKRLRTRKLFNCINSGGCFQANQPV